MKVILYCASTINGLCAKIDGDSDWVSSEDTVSFNSIVRAVGCAIMGRKTFDIFNTMPIAEWPNSEGLHIILTSQLFLPSIHPQVKFATSPQTSLDLAAQLGKTDVVVIGGGRTFGSYLKERLVDELYLDIEPLAFGTGIPLFDAGDFESHLQLIETKPLSSQTIQLHYKVLKV